LFIYFGLLVFATMYLVNKDVYIVICTPAVLEAGIVFGGVCLSVCLHKVSKTNGQKLAWQEYVLW